MIKEMFTHVVDHSGQCVRCNRAIPAPDVGINLKKAPVDKAHPNCLLIGMIVSDFGGVQTYFVGEHDSNQRCSEITD